MMGQADFDVLVAEALNKYKQNVPTGANTSTPAPAPISEPVATPEPVPTQVPAPTPVATPSPPEAVPSPEAVTPPLDSVTPPPESLLSSGFTGMPRPQEGGSHRKRTRKLSYKRKSRQNRRKYARRLTKRNFLF